MPLDVLQDPAPQRVLVLFPNIAPGGTERVLQTLWPLWAQHHDMHAAVLALPPSSSFNAKALPSGHLHVLPGLALGGLRKYWVWLRAWQQLVKTVQPTVVLSFGEVPIVLTALAQRLGLHSPSIRLVHNVRNHESTFLAQARWGGLKQKVLAWALRTGHAVTGNSQTIVDELHQHFACTAPCHVVYNPVDASRFAPPTWLQRAAVNGPDQAPRAQLGASVGARVGSTSTTQAAPTTFHVLAVGRLDPQKGFAHLLRAFARVQAELPQVHLTIVGEGPERETLQKIIQELNLCNVLLPGWRDDVPSLMHKADVFCLSSLWEGMPNVLLEAMAAGLPVVAFDCPSGPREILQDGQHGLLLPVGDEAALACALLRLANSPSERLQWAQRAHARAAVFEPAAIAQQWLGLINAATPNKEYSERNTT